MTTVQGVNFYITHLFKFSKVLKLRIIKGVLLGVTDRALILGFLNQIHPSLLHSDSLSPKYSHFWFQNTKMVTAEMLKSRLQNTSPQTNCRHLNSYIPYFLQSVTVPASQKCENMLILFLFFFNFI